MNSIEWFQLNQEERGFARIKERAYFFSTHRRMENRQPDPQSDWLNAEWVENHLNAYHILEIKIGNAVLDTLLMFDRTVRYDTNLPFDEFDKKILKRRLRELALNLDIETALNESKTFAGLMASLVIQIRQRK